MYPNIVDKQSVDVEEVPCTVLSMDFFDRLEDNNIVMKSGNIQKCYDEFHEGITIADELRKVLIVYAIDLTHPLWRYINRHQSC